MERRIGLRLSIRVRNPARSRHRPSGRCAQLRVSGLDAAQLLHRTRRARTMVPIPPGAIYARLPPALPDRLDAEFTIAYWLLLPIALILPTIAFARYRRRRRRETNNLCPTCGYDLRAHNAGDRCPECGRVVTPSRAACAMTPCCSESSLPSRWSRSPSLRAGTSRPAGFGCGVPLDGMVFAERQNFRGMCRWQYRVGTSRSLWNQLRHPPGRRV